jgi:hypothetical protein
MVPLGGALATAIITQTGSSRHCSASGAASHDPAELDRVAQSGIAWTATAAAEPSYGVYATWLKPAAVNSLKMPARCAIARWEIHLALERRTA